MSDDKSNGQNTEFLDLEMSKVLYGEARKVTREAYRELLKEAAKRRLSERWGDRIESLAQLAVDNLLADTEANLEIEARISERQQARSETDQQLERIIKGERPGDDDDDDDD